MIIVKSILLILFLCLAFFIGVAAGRRSVFFEDSDNKEPVVIRKEEEKPETKIEDADRILELIKKHMISVKDPVLLNQITKDLHKCSLRFYEEMCKNITRGSTEFVIKPPNTLAGCSSEYLGNFVKCACYLLYSRHGLVFEWIVRRDQSIWIKVKAPSSS